MSNAARIETIMSAVNSIINKHYSDYSFAFEFLDTKDIVLVTNRTIEAFRNDESLSQKERDLHLMHVCPLLEAIGDGSTDLMKTASTAVTFRSLKEEESKVGNIYINTEMLPVFSDEEVVAILLHEIGHFVNVPRMLSEANRSNVPDMIPDKSFDPELFVETIRTSKHWLNPNRTPEEFNNYVMSDQHAQVFVNIMLNEVFADICPLEHSYGEHMVSVIKKLQARVYECMPSDEKEDVCSYNDRVTVLEHSLARC